MQRMFMTQSDSGNTLILERNPRLDVGQVYYASSAECMEAMLKEPVDREAMQKAVEKSLEFQKRVEAIRDLPEVRYLMMHAREEGREGALWEISLPEADTSTNRFPCPTKPTFSDLEAQGVDTLQCEVNP